MTLDQAAFIEAHQKLKRGIVAGRAPARVMHEIVDSERRRRSLQTCHRYSAHEQVRQSAPKDTGAYVPELSATLENDPNLSDGARRCARKIAEITYRTNREGRSLVVTVSYIARALGRCCRTVQRYLRQLEREGYIGVDVLASPGSRMCVGLVVRLGARLFARHHRRQWPDSVRNPGATLESHKYKFNHYTKDMCPQMPVHMWAMRCMDGVFRSFMKTDPLPDLPPMATSA